MFNSSVLVADTWPVKFGVVPHADPLTGGDEPHHRHATSTKNPATFTRLAPCRCFWPISRHARPYDPNSIYKFDSFRPKETIRVEPPKMARGRRICSKKFGCKAPSIERMNEIC